MVTPLDERPRSGPYSGINARSAKRFLTEQFKQVGFDAAEEDARDLVMAVTGFSLTDFIIRGTEFLTPEQFDQIKAYADRRLSGEPVDHILGWREFYGRPFDISKDVLSPRGDTEALIRCALEGLKGKAEPYILDLGTGSGAIIVTLLAELESAKGQAVDISREALAIARQNADQYDVADRLNLFQGDWYAPVRGVFDLIISNPPYITDEAMKGLTRDVIDFDPDIALRGGTDGLKTYPIILEGAVNHMKPEGWLWVEIGYDQGEAVKAMFESRQFQHVKVVKDYGGNDRCVGGQIGASHVTENLK